MGGLVARGYVEGADYGNDVDHLFLIGPPNHGSALAKAQTLLQFIQGLQSVKGQEGDALAQLSEGLGEAADDMVPGSAFLKELNARPRRDGVRYHILTGDAGVPDPRGPRADRGAIRDLHEPPRPARHADAGSRRVT